MAVSLKHLLVGKPIPTERAHHERLPKITALAVFASDAISSTAYATQEIMLALMLAVGFAAVPQTRANLHHLLPIGFAIAALIVVVSISYRQTINAYPNGGGAYIVAKDNLGDNSGLVAAAALLIDYVLTVAVSVAAGVSAITSAYPHMLPFTVWLCVACIGAITLANLRGVKESGTIFAIPTYGFILALIILLIVGFYRFYFGGGLASYAPLDAQQGIINPALKPLTAFLLLRAFASGCTALTGIEAISNGVPAFRPPESRNAATTLVWMSAILVTIFIGITVLAYLSHTQPILQTEKSASGALVAVMEHGHLADPPETVLSVLARRIFTGSSAWFYFVVQGTTAAILVLAANTAFADFPRLASLLARDRFLPRQLSNLGDRLVFNNGIAALLLLSSLLIWWFKGSVTALIALYAIGVFLSFTLSQAGMVIHWWRLRVPRWQISAIVNGLGACATLVVMCVITITKFTGGAWVVVVAIPLIVMVLKKINHHYRSVASQLTMEGYRPRQGRRHHIFVLVSDIHRGVIPALQYARSLSPDVRALHVSIDSQREQRLRERWTLFSRGVPLTILPSPYRSLVEPVLEFIDDLKEQEENSLITVVIPEFVPRAWWAKLLHGQAGFLLALKLHEREDVIVTNVPYHIKAMVSLPTEAPRTEAPLMPPSAHSAPAHTVPQHTAL